MDNEVQFLIYSTAQEDVKIDVVVKDETIWLTQKSMAELFGVGVPAISKHLANIYEEGELSSDATISKMETVQSEGSRRIKRSVDFYNLDAIISVGYNTYGHPTSETLERLQAHNIPIYRTDQMGDITVHLS